MTDLKLKSWLKFFSKWKTYPQVYINGKIIGGLDSTLNLIKEGKILPLIPKEFKKISVEEKVRRIFSYKVVAFVSQKSPMKLIKILMDNGVIYHIYDFSKDEKVQKCVLEKCGFEDEDTLLYIEGKGYSLE